MGSPGVKLKGQIFNFVRFQRLGCQIVRLGPAIKSVNGDPIVRPFLGVKGQVKGVQEGQILNFVRFQRLRCQLVRLGIAIKSVNGDPIVRPFLGGQRSKERSNFQLCPISKVNVSNCSSWTSDHQSVNGDPVVRPFPGGQRSKVKGQIFNFVRFQRLRCQIVCLGPAIKSVNGDPVVRPFLGGQRSKERSIFQFCPISKVKVSNCLSLTSDQKF